MADNGAVSAEIVLEKLQIAVQNRFSKEVLEVNCAIGAEGDWCKAVVDQMVCQLHGFLYAEHAGEIFHEQPKSWWQMFKEQYFPYWLQDRWAVKYDKLHWDFKCLYPDFRPSLPDQKVVIHAIRNYENDD